MMQRFIATCPAGLEQLVAEEIASFGGSVTETSAGSVAYSGALEAAYRSCIWSRCASRILMPLVSCNAADADELYRGAVEFPWKEHTGVENSFAVDCTARQAVITHTRYAALRVKDAIADYFRKRFNRRPSVDTERPSVRFVVLLEGAGATLCLDLAGESLHRRGYRRSAGAAPLKETVAAAMVRTTGGPPSDSLSTAVLDPLCGSGTILIEAACAVGDIAPGLFRSYWGCEGWKHHNTALWRRLMDEARQRREAGLKRRWPRIIGYDADRHAVRHAIDNIERAGLTGRIHVERRDLATVTNPLSSGSGRFRLGCIITNPPYGKRMESAGGAAFLYRFLGRLLVREFAGWRAGIICPDPAAARELAMPFQSRSVMYNGPIRCSFNVAVVPAPSRERDTASLSVSPASDRFVDNAFANRLRKNARHVMKWARREGVSCYRIYDRDIPEYNVTIDVYEQWLHVQEYEPPDTVDPAMAAKRRRKIVQSVREVMQVGDDAVFRKTRKRQRGKRQYAKHEHRRRFYEVHEDTCRFLVNFTDYIDVGLFLDQRIVRRLIRSKARGARFLNLFGYTGTATVYAAAGGAAASATVDASAVYTAWARNNLLLNGFSDALHRLIRSDCMEWLSGTREQYDLMYIAPPVFSNAKKARKFFDLQKDHAELLRLALRRLEPGGTILFAASAKRFKLDSSALAGCDVADISRSTLPYDFRRSAAGHACWEIRRRRNG